MGRVVLDSSVLIALYNRNDLHHGIVLTKFGSESNQYEISAIGLMETLVAPFADGPGTSDRVLTAIDGSIAVIHPVTERIAVAAAKIRAKTKMKVPDAIISATATLVGAQLWTLDRRLAKAHKGAVLIV
ncbi:MAG: PIN domain-containing protein [Actinomycetota bacterium]